MNKQQKSASDDTARNSITVAAAASVVMLLLAANMISTVESRDDLTTIRFYDCNVDTLPPDSYYISLARSLLEDVVDEAPTQPYYTYSTFLSINGVSAYVFGDCDPARSLADCTDCLTANRLALFDICLNATGAQIVMNACYMRYENYSF